MPTTRAQRARMTRFIIDLPADALAHVLYYLTFAHDIAAAATLCRAFRHAARITFKARPYSNKVVTLNGHAALDGNGHNALVGSVAAVPDHVITGSGTDIKLWRDEVCVRTIKAAQGERPVHPTTRISKLAALPGGERIICCWGNGTVQIYTLDGTCECQFLVQDFVKRPPETLWYHWYMISSLVVMPDGVHFLIGLMGGEIRMYHVDGTMVYTIDAHICEQYPALGVNVAALAVTTDGKHIVSGATSELGPYGPTGELTQGGPTAAKVWKVDTQELLSTCLPPPYGHLAPEAARWPGHAGGVHAVAVVPGSRRFLSADGNGSLHVWLLDGTLVNTFRGLSANSHSGLHVLPDRQHAMCASSRCDMALEQYVGGSVIFRVDDGTILRHFTHHKNVPQQNSSTLFAFALLPDGLRFVSAGLGQNFACVAYHGLAPPSDM